MKIEYDVRVRLTLDEFDSALITSDLHFGHKKIKLFCDRTRIPLSDGHDKAIIDNINSRVVPDNTPVFILGDLGFSTRAKTLECLSQIRGRVFVVFGNHDLTYIPYLKKNCPENVTFLGWYAEVYLEGQSFTDSEYCAVLSHFPLADYAYKKSNCIMMHGHTHGNSQHVYRSIDVGLDSEELHLGLNGSVRPMMSPWLLKDVFDYVKSRDFEYVKRFIDFPQ